MAVAEKIAKVITESSKRMMVILLLKTKQKAIFRKG